MKRKACIKNEQDSTLMTPQNLKICLNNQEGAFQTVELNQSLHLQYYGFCNIDNLKPFVRIHTLYLNNNLIQKIENLQFLSELRTLNLSYNRIKILQNINSLHNLYSLDLSNNFIENVPAAQVEGLQNLNSFKLRQNRLKTYEGIKGLIKVANSLTYLDLAANEELEFNPLLYAQLLAKMKVSVLGLNSTLFSRSATNYRKEVILAMKELKFLDERPVTNQERMLAEAWKEGGIQLQKQVRAQIKEKKVQKSNKIYTQMEQRNQIVEQKRQRVYSKLTEKQTKQLHQLQKQKSEESFQALNYQDKNLLNIKIEELQKYLQLMRQAVKYMDLEKQLGQGRVQLPKMLIEKQTKDAIFVYNVTQEQIPLITQKYYPEQTRPIVAVNYEKPTETRWIKEYDYLLKQAYLHAKGNIQLLVPLFNLELYQFDEETSRKLKRFQVEQLRQHWQDMNEEQLKVQRRIEAYDELD